MVVHNVRLRTRGIYRKNYCSMPPFWLNIKNSGIYSYNLNRVNKIKIVTNCMNPDHFQDYLMKEYLIYKMYNIVSPYSFRVRLLKITYIDTGRDNKTTEKWGFAIEPEEMLAKRLNGYMVEDKNIGMKTMNPSVMDVLAMFQYMIGNGDYSVAGMHNIKIIILNSPGPTGFVPIPNDFDYTGIVNARYAVPGEKLGISSVTDRYFLGPCRSDEFFEMALQDLKDLEKDFLDLVQPFEYLSIERKLEFLRYLEDFYTEAADENFIRDKIRSTCR